MSFFAPAALGLLALVPLVVLLYFMKLRRREVAVSASFLWKRALSQARVDSFFQRLRINILLILQIIAIILCVLALARPFVRAAGVLPGQVVLVLDVSASMQARMASGGTRFDAARERALSLVRQAPPRTRIMLVAATTRAIVESPFTDDREVIARRLREMRALDTSTDLRPAVLLALSSVRGQRDARVFVFTDRELDEKDALLHYVPVASAARNLAVTAFEVRADEVFCTVRSFVTEPASAYLELRLNDQLVDARQVSLASAGEQSFAFRVPGSGVLEARLVAADDLPVDNRAWAVVSEAATPRVLLVSDGNPFLEKVLSLLPSTRVFKVAPAAYRPGGDYAVTVWDGVAPRGALRGGHMVLNAPLAPEAEGPYTMSFERDDPLFRHVDLSLVGVAAGRPVAATAARVLARGHAGERTVPLVAMVEPAGARILYVGFDLYKSDFPLAASFPIFIANAVRVLGGTAVTAPPSAVRVEQPLELLTADSTVVTPSGATVKVRGATLHDTTAVGVYTAGNSKIAVNLLDASESDLSPPRSAETAPRSGATATERPFTRELWWPILLLGLVMLVGEWAVFHRNVA